MRPRFRLKTKLVLAISGMVTAVVVAFATIFIFQLVHQRLSDTFENGDFVAHQIYDATRQSLEMDLSSTRVDMQDPQAVRDAYEEILQTDPGLNSLLQSIVGYSKPIYDVAVADAQGRALLHTDPNVSLKNQVLPARQDFRQVANGGFRRQLEVVYGPPQLYEIRVPLERGGLPFGSVRVGISTIFLKSELRPQLDRALLLAGTAIFITLLLAAALSNLALRPLAIIGRRLDLMTDPGGEAETEAEREQEPDEVNAVTTKINRLGRQMRDVKEVFTALKDNLDQIMANLQDGLILFTRDARAILVSAAVERFLGIPRQQMLGHNAGEFFTHETQIGRLVLDAFMDHQALSPRDIETEDGRRIQIALDFIEEGGERIGALLTLRDAESVRRIESEIELSHRLAAIGRLASGVGHEVKNPINAIVVHLEVLRQKLQQMDPDTRRHMDVIASEIQRLDRVVQMLIDFTRPVELRLTDIDLSRIVDEVLSLASPDAERHGVRVIRQLAAETLPVRVDADLLKQALLNVVLNGVQAMPQGGNLEVAARRAGDREIVIEVRDQGAGIAPEIRDKVFNLYFTTKKAGTGIGLAMTYKVMQLHHGSVDFAPASPRGTVFQLTLPLQEQPAEAAREFATHDSATV
ncbi:MAG: PAS domain-containing sensor histidine kinase [Acidobacteria bacterium]|nr:MAG: PAS domain-containing sensor histidine kinase [Acidobacteriota bacterium]